jgi:hypothetical protein
MIKKLYIFAESIATLTRTNNLDAIVNMAIRPLSYSLHSIKPCLQQAGKSRAARSSRPENEYYNFNPKHLVIIIKPWPDVQTGRPIRAIHDKGARSDLLTLACAKRTYICLIIKTN